MAKLVKVTTLKTLDDLNTSLAEYKIVKAELEEKTAELNVKRTKLEMDYTPDLTALNERKLSLESNIELFAEENKTKYFADKKRSIDVLHGRIGFRLSKKLSKMKKFTWENVLENIRTKGKKFASYIKTKEEINKEALKDDIQNEVIKLDDARLIGVTIEEVDNFFIETNSITPEDVK